MRRRIIAFNHVSADGYFTTPGGKLDWVVADDEVERAMAGTMGSADTILFGRKTYDMFEAFWPQALQDPQGATDPHAQGRRSPALQKMAQWIDDAQKLVFSRNRGTLTWKNSRLMPAIDPREIEALKRAPGGEMMIFGSGSVASRLAEHRLIDEFRFLSNPVILGEGRPLLSGITRRTALRLVECRAFPSGNVLRRYELV